jgi:hypothetical protein
MNDTMSLLLATGILAVGGLGLFMYKNSSEGESFLSEEENGDKKEENWFDFDLRSFFGNSEDDEDDQKDDDGELEVYETKTKSRGSKTKSLRKTGSTKRRY